MRLIGALSEILGIGGNIFEKNEVFCWIVEEDLLIESKKSSNGKAIIIYAESILHNDSKIDSLFCISLISSEYEKSKSTCEYSVSEFSIIENIVVNIDFIDDIFQNIKHLDSVNEVQILIVQF